MIHMIWLNLSVKYSNIQWRNDFIIITSLWRHTFWSKYRNFIYFLLQEALCSSKKRGNKSLIIQKWFYSAITIRDPRTAKSGNRPVRIGPRFWNFSGSWSGPVPGFKTFLGPGTGPTGFGPWIPDHYMFEFHDLITVQFTSLATDFHSSESKLSSIWGQWCCWLKVGEDLWMLVTSHECWCPKLTWKKIEVLKKSKNDFLARKLI